MVQRKADTTRNGYLAVTVALASLALLSPKAEAVLLVPTQTAPAAGSTTQAAGTILADITVPITGIFDIAAGSNIREIVARRTGAVPGNPDPIGLVPGGLDFYFQITNSAASPGDIHATGFNFYTGLITDVVYNSDPDGQNPILAPGEPINGLPVGTIEPLVEGRSNIGSTIAFLFPDPSPQTGASEAITPGTASKWLVIRTNATIFASGIASITNGVTNNYTVLGPIPEPTTALFGCALVGVALSRRKRSATC